MYYTMQSFWLPDDDDGEIEEIPAVAQVRALMRHEAVRHDLHDALGCEDNEEEVLDFFLQKWGAVVSFAKF